MRSFFHFLFCCCLFIGCESREPYPIQITIFLDDKPLEGAIVSLEPVQNFSDHQAVLGTTDTEGNVTFKTGESDGIMPGTYIVLASKKIEEKKLTNGEIRALAEKGIRYKPVIIELVPPKYTRRESSDIKIKVGYWSDKKFSFPLRSKEEKK